MQLASSFHYDSPMLRADSPLSDDQIRRVAPSIFADGKHESRSERYARLQRQVLASASSPNLVKRSRSAVLTTLPVLFFGNPSTTR